MKTRPSRSTPATSRRTPAPGSQPPTARSAWRDRVRHTWTEAGRHWERWEPVLASSMAAVDPFLIRALELAPGQRVLDFGCGLGDPALTLAPLVAPRGTVLGIDLSRPMIEAARRRAKARGVPNVRFRVGDVTRLDPDERFHRAVSRYGIMFPEDIEGLLVQLRRRLVAGGRVAFTVWGPRERNRYFEIVADAVRPHLPEPPPAPESQPHALRFADVRRLTRLLRRAGFRDVRAEGVQSPFTFQSGEQYAEVVMEVSGSTRELLARISEEAKHRFRGKLVRAAETHRDGDVVRLPGFAWVVSAQR